MLRVVHVIIATVVFALVTLSTKDAYSHSSQSLPVRIDTHSYVMKPGDTLTREMRICSMVPGNLVINNVTFNGTNSGWAKVDEQQFPVTAHWAANGTARAFVPVTVTVPSNFTGNHALVHTIVNTTGPIPIPVQSDLRIFISNNTVTPQNLPECQSLLNIKRGFQYNAIVLGSVGAGLVTLGYFVYRRSRARSEKHKAGIGAKILLVFLALLGSFLIVLAFRLLLP